MTSDFMAQRHTDFSTSQEDIFSLVVSSTNKQPVSYTKVVKGFDNEVYRVETKQGKNFFVRIHRFGEVKPSQEIWVMEQLRKAGVPVAETFFTGQISLPDGQHEVMVISELPGKPLAEIRHDLAQAQLDQALISAGQVLRKIHSVKVDGFYRRHNDGSWDFPDWQSFTSSLDARTKEKELILSAGFSEDDFGFMLKMIELNSHEFPCSQPVLNHGDYLPEHIFVDDNLQVSGVIDFGEYQGAPPIHDFAFFSFEAPRLNLSALIEGYGNHEMFHDKFELRLNLHRLPVQMGYLAHEIRQKNAEAVKFLSEGLKSTLLILRRLNNT